MEECAVVNEFFSRYGKLLELDLTGQMKTSVKSAISGRIGDQKSAADLFHAEKSESDRALADLKTVNLAAPTEELLVEYDLTKYRSLRRVMTGRR